MHHEQASDETCAFEEILRFSDTRENPDVETGGSVVRGPVDRGLEKLLPDTHFTRRRIDIEDFDGRKVRGVGQLLDSGHRRSDWNVLDHPEQSEPLIVVEHCCELRLQWFDERFFQSVDTATPLADELVTETSVDLDECPQVTLGHRADGHLHLVRRLRVRRRLSRRAVTLRIQLGDPVQHGAATPSGRLVLANGLELDGSERGKPLDDL